MPAARRTRARGARVLLGAAVTLCTLAVTGCAGDDKARSEGIDPLARACRADWHDLAESVIGLDQDSTPSALASRWTSVIATIDYYETSARASDCPEAIEQQQRAISDLRRFSDQLRPYDMSYQLSHVRAAVDLYLNDALPEPVAGPDGKPVKPPTKAAVSAAFATLEAQASAADADLQPAWAQIASVDLADAEQLRNAVADLDDLAQTSAAWKECEEAVQVLVAAIRAQEGIGAPTPSNSPTGTPTP